MRLAKDLKAVTGPGDALIFTDAALYDRLYLMEDDRLQAVWNVVGRGKSQ